MKSLRKLCDFSGCAKLSILSTFPVLNISLLLSRSFLLLGALLLLPTASPAQAADLLVAAASDLATSEKALAESFEMATGHRIRFVLHSSGMLARQIQNGAPYDVYLSANEQYVEELAASGDLLPETVKVYALGRLGLWSKSLKLQTIDDLKRDEVRRVAIANPAHAPYGVAAKAALENRGLWGVIQEKVVFGENVRQTFQYGDSGNADAIITSWTLVLGKGAIMLPSEWHNPIRQAGGVIKRSKNRRAAEQFLDFLMSPRGQSVLREHGLFPPDGPQ